MIHMNTSKGLRITRERKVGIITNTNDTYEYIEGATSNQGKKGRNYSKYQMYSYISLVFAIIPTFRSLVTRSPFNVFVRIIGICYNSYLSFSGYSKVLRVTRERKVGIITNTNDTYEYIEGATSNQTKKGRNYNKYQ
jgi:Asp/Glu/hydantoin racemase